MILQEEFKKNGYISILDEKIAPEYGIYIDDLYDKDQKPKELLNIFISEHGDELFFLLDAEEKDINSLCDSWDNRLRVFTILNKKSKVIHKFMYNIIQLIIYSKDVPDKSRQRNLQISRKIFIKGDMEDKKNIIINEDEAIELPFYMISADEFAPDNEKIKQLNKLIPADDNLLILLEKERKKINKTKKDGINTKTFSEQEYNKIREWLEKC